MKNLPTYSNILHCVYDEPKETGSIGRGSHHSVFRVPEWFDVTGQPVKQALQHKFSVIWDEDHDTRIIPVIERLYFEGLLFPVQFIGERKGGITVILAAKYWWAHGEQKLNAYKAKFEKIAGDVPEDYWATDFGMFDKAMVDGMPHQTDLAGIIQDNAQKVDTYIRNINNLWTIGSWSKMQPEIDGSIEALI
jgi:hypothetical protein